MAQTIYASFTDVDQAERAAGALLDHGVSKEDISLVAQASGTRRFQEQEVGVSNPEQAYAIAGEGSFATSPFNAPNDLNIGAYPDPARPSTIGGLPIGDSTEYDSSRTDRYADNNLGEPNYHKDHSQAEAIAKSGITTTTPEDAGVGALKGTGIGLGIGILAGLAALVVPGVGLVVGAGALAGALGVAASTTVAGAAVGGLVGYLKDQGVPESDAQRFHHAVGSGGALLAVSIPSNGVDLQETEVLLNKYGAADISSY